MCPGPCISTAAMPSTALTGTTASASNIPTAASTSPWPTPSGSTTGPPPPRTIREPGFGCMTSSKQMTWAEVCAQRLERHALSAPAQDARPADIAGAMCGAHAQILSAAELSIGLRIAGLTRKDVRKALWTERSLVKTYGPRGTVHLLSTQDLSMWIGALS